MFTQLVDQLLKTLNVAERNILIGPWWFHQSPLKPSFKPSINQKS